jgi:hypothetical protein
MAKHWIYEAARRERPVHEDGDSLDAQRMFTDSELKKFTSAINVELEKMRVRLVKENIIVDG